MTQVVGVRFKSVGKVYYFDPGELDIKQGNHVIVETVRGVEFGDVVIAGREVGEEEIVSPLKKVMRIADEKDIKTEEENKRKEKEAFDTCLEKIKKHNLEMKLVDVEYTFDNNKILFYFTADGRVDFRELVKDLASVFKTRIELRQIGVRDESKMMGGMGICGRALCCSSFLGEFQPVSIKMAKEQGLSLNPAKISGSCGRLMCCLKYEQEAYDDAVRRAPRIGALIETPDGQGTVIEVNLLKENAKVRFEKNDGTVVRNYKLDQIKVIKDTRAKVPEEEVVDAELKILEDEPGFIRE
ncbi:MAG: stage 0 sporulation family protein [Eubacteriales bacterium]|nr:stage 0 sporulation family protein [Eubacteriales bacterium]